MSIGSEQPTDDPARRKARGAFFTPAAISRYIVEWAVRSADDLVMEPSVGDAAFLTEAVEALRGHARLRGDSESVPRVDGVEIHEESARQARAAIRVAGGDPNILVSDFFQVAPDPRYTAIIGNPPYIRYQDFAGLSRTAARQAALRSGVNLSGLASSWAAFVVHSTAFLRRGGRLGFVLPAELLSVNYAAPVREFLFNRFRRVDLVLFAERVFPEAEADVVLLLADGWDEGPSDRAAVVQVRNTIELRQLPIAQHWTPADPSGKWTASLLERQELSLYSDVVQLPALTALSGWGETTLGMVTGSNAYFALGVERARELGLDSRDLLPLSPPGSGHLRGLSYSRAAWNASSERGEQVWLFRPPAELNSAAASYVQAGEIRGVHLAYKCRVRRPWWRVPRLEAPSLFLTYMNADTPRLVANTARVHHLNSVHGLYLHENIRAVPADLAIASLNSLTILSAEITGRAYGGGLLKIEPREADQLLVPDADLVVRLAPRLREIRRAVAGRLRSGNLTAAAALVDQVLLVEGAGLRTGDVETLRAARARLAGRRAARGATRFSGDEA
jgi:adenine-specific DNA-methyltransferase